MNLPIESFPIAFNEAELAQGNLLLHKIGEGSTNQPVPEAKVVAEFRERDENGNLRTAAHILLNAAYQG